MQTYFMNIIYIRNSKGPKIALYILWTLSNFTIWYVFVRLQPLEETFEYISKFTLHRWPNAGNSVKTSSSSIYLPCYYIYFMYLTSIWPKLIRSKYIFLLFCSSRTTFLASFPYFYRTSFLSFITHSVYVPKLSEYVFIFRLFLLSLLRRTVLGKITFSLLNLYFLCVKIFT